MRVLPLDTASMMTFPGSGTYLQTQPLPNSAEALQTEVAEQHLPSQRLTARKTAIKDGMSGANRAQLLNGWKEIANYMHQGVRTVQRWEALGLPVRRVRASKSGPVIAFAEDLDFWARCLHVPLLDSIEELRARISSLEGQIRSLKRQLRVRNRPARVDKTSHAVRQLSQNFASVLPPQSRLNNSSRLAINDVDEGGA